MARADNAQLNIRSRFARERATELARRTGMTATQVVEEALRAYTPPAAPTDAGETLPPGLVRRGSLLVLTGGLSMTLEDWNEALEATREERARYVEGSGAEG